MKKLQSLVLVSMVMFASSAFAVPAERQEHTRVTNPNAVGLEFFGRGMLYSFFFDRVATDDIVGGAGIGSVSMRDLAGNDVSKSATVIPVYLNYYFARQAGSLFATFGANLITNADSVKGLKSSLGGIEFGSDAMHPTFGVGFESRGDAGFLLRATGYGIYGGKKLQPWVGISFGYCF